MQWFLKMQHFADLALPPVMNDELKFYPAKYKNTYRHWLENIKDWCISRQLWWGHRIPAYYLPTGGFVVAETAEKALELARTQSGNADLQLTDLKQDEDALDTWFSSWLWPISLFKGINNPGNEELQYYYPTADLVTGPDIIFFWVARMIMAGYEYTGDMPFRNVYFTGIVRDKLGRKMSKSLGNSPDPLDLIDTYGADGVRMGMMFSAPAGNDILFDDTLCEQGRNFCNKIWNAFRLIKSWNVDATIEEPETAKESNLWFAARLRQSAGEITDLFKKYRLSEALHEVYSLFWDDFSASYLEMIKPAYGSPIDSATYTTALGFFDHLLHLLHPFMPFITEELWQHLAERKEGESIMVSPMTIPAPQEGDEALLMAMNHAKNIIANIRAVRNSKNISPRQEVKVLATPTCPVSSLKPLIKKLAAAEIEDAATETADGAVAFMVETTRYALLLGDLVDNEAEKEKAIAEIKRLEGFLMGVNKKLENERFVSSAPAAVVELERKKKADAETKIEALKNQFKL